MVACYIKELKTMRNVDSMKSRAHAVVVHTILGKFYLFKARFCFNTPSECSTFKSPRGEPDVRGNVVGMYQSFELDKDYFYNT